MSDIQRKEAEAEIVKVPNPPIPPTVTEISQATMEIPRSELSKTGQEVLSDIQQVAEVTQKIVEEKMQPAAAEARVKVQQLTGEESEEGISLIKEELDTVINILKSGKEDYQHFAKLLFYSGSFRNLFFDLVYIVQDSLKDVRYEYKEVQTSELDVLETSIKGKEKEGKSAKVVSLSDEAWDKLCGRFVGWLRQAKETSEFIEALNFANSQLSNLEGLSLFNLTVKDRSELTVDEQKMRESLGMSEPIRVGIQAKVFIEHWIGCSLDPFLKSLEGISQSIMSDKEAENSLLNLSDWFKACLKEESIDECKRKEEFKSYVSAVRTSVADKYRGDINHLMEETNVVVERAKRDELSVKLTSNLEDLFNHLFKDESGNLTVKPELWSDLKLILPVFFRHLRFIQIPELTVRDESVDFKASALTISIGELAPKRIQAHFYTDLDTAERDLGEVIGSDYDLQSLFIVEAGKIFAEARNVYFDLDKKSFPSLSDSGIADLNIHGDDGMTLRLVFGARRIGGAQGRVLDTGGFKLLRTRCNIDKLDLRLHETKHGWMYTVLGPLIRRQLKGKIEEAIEKYMMTGDWSESFSNPEKITEALKATVV